MSQLAIQVNNLSKVYRLYDSPVDRLKESLHPLRKKYHEDFYALRNLSFEVRKGESIGIIGKNGSGKSTLLKILTGVLTPSNGNVTVNGKVSALLELGAGFNRELTGIENVFFNGALMGYTREEMESKLDDIMSFADIGNFVYQPVKMYSSGMFVRLAFALAVIVKPDILIVDEALSVGDVFFQQKCFSKIKEIISSGATLLFVTHSMPVMQNLCKRAILLKNGIIVKDGDSVECASAYFLTETPEHGGANNIDRDKKNVLKIVSADGIADAESILNNNIIKTAQVEQGEKGLEIIAASFSSDHGGSSFTITMFDNVEICVLLKANQFVVAPNVGFSLFDRMNNLVFSTSTLQQQITIPSLEEGENKIVTFKIRFAVSPGEYTFALGCGEPIASEPGTSHTHHRWIGMGPLNVHPESEDLIPFYGFAELPVEVSVK